MPPPRDLGVDAWLHDDDDDDDDEDDAAEKVKPNSKHVHTARCSHVRSTPPGGLATGHDHAEEIRLYNMSTCAKLTEMEWLHTEASAMFREGQFARARNRFQDVLGLLDYTFVVDGEDDAESVARETNARLRAERGLALCFLHMERWREAEMHATRALEVSPSDARARFARAKARRMLGSLTDARADLEALAAVAANNVHVREELRLVTVAERVYAAKQKRVAAGMFS